MQRIQFSPLRKAALVALALLAAGCSSSGSPAGPGGSSLTQNDADDLALQATIALDPWVPVIESSGNLSSPAPVPNEARFKLETTMGGIPVWHDTTFTRGNVTFELSRRWFDLFGDAQDEAGATTDSVYATSRIYGSETSQRFDASIGHAGWIGIGGLNPLRTVLHINGASDDTLTTHFTAIVADVERFCESRASTALDDVMWTKPGAGPATYPSSGAATIVLAWTRFTDSGRGTIDKSASATVVVTFNGTATPDVTVNGTWHYVWNLDTGGIVRSGGV